VTARGQKVREQVVAYVLEHPEGVRLREIAKDLDRTRASVSSALQRAVKLGELRAEGNTAAREYFPPRVAPAEAEDLGEAPPFGPRESLGAFVETARELGVELEPGDVVRKGPDPRSGFGEAASIHKLRSELEAVRGELAGVKSQARDLESQLAEALAELDYSRRTLATLQDVLEDAGAAKRWPLEVQLGWLAGRSERQ